MTSRQALPADGPGEVAGRGPAMGEGVEIARVVERLHQRLLGVTRRLVGIPLGVGDEPGIFVVAIGVLGNALNLVFDLPQRLVDAADGVGSLVGGVVGQLVEGDEGVDILAEGAEGGLEEPAPFGGIAAGRRGTRGEEVGPGMSGPMVAAELGELLLDIEIAPGRVWSEQAPEARRCLLLAAEFVEVFGGEDRGVAVLVGQGLRIVENGRVGTHRPVNASPPRHDQARLHHQPAVAPAPLGLDGGEGGVCQGRRPAEITAGPFGGGRGAGHKRIGRDQVGTGIVDLVDDPRDAEIGAPRERLDRPGGDLGGGDAVPLGGEQRLARRDRFVFPAGGEEHGDPRAGEDPPDLRRVCARASLIAVVVLLLIGSFLLGAVVAVGAFEVRQRRGCRSERRVSSRGRLRRGEFDHGPREGSRRPGARPQPGGRAGGDRRPPAVVGLPFPHEERRCHARSLRRALQADDPRQSLDAGVVVDAEEAVHDTDASGEVSLFVALEQPRHLGGVVRHAEGDRVDEPSGPQRDLEIAFEFGGRQQGIDRRGADRLELGRGCLPALEVGVSQPGDEGGDRLRRGLGGGDAGRSRQCRRERKQQRDEQPLGSHPRSPGRVMHGGTVEDGGSGGHALQSSREPRSPR